MDDRNKKKNVVKVNNTNTGVFIVSFTPFSIVSIVDFKQVYVYLAYSSN